MQQLPRGILDPVRQTNPHRRRQRHVAPKLVGVVEEHQRAGNLLLAHRQVQRLPRPPRAIHVAVVQVEQRVRRRHVRVRHGAVQPADGPVAARVEGGRVGGLLKGAKVGDRHGLLDLRGAREVAQRGVREVAAHAARRGAGADVLRAELGGEAGEGAGGDAAAAAAVGEVKGRAADLWWV